MESEERKLQLITALRKLASELESSELLSVDDFSWGDELSFKRGVGFAPTRVFRAEFRYRTSDGSEPASE